MLEFNTFENVNSLTRANQIRHSCRYVSPLYSTFHDINSSDLGDTGSHFVLRNDFTNIV